MWCLARPLPLMIKNLLPIGDQHWDCFLILLQILDYVFALIVSKGIASYLDQLINEHHQLFREIYPDFSIIPKAHYMVHLGKYIKL